MRTGVLRLGIPLHLAIVGLAGATALTFLVSRVDAPMALGAVIALAGLLLVFAAPFLGVLLGVFVLYTNLPAGAAAHGVIPNEATALVGALFIPAFLQQLVLRRSVLRVDRTFALMVAFLGVMFVSGYFAVDVPLVLSYISSYAVEGLVVFLLVLNTVRDRRSLTRVLAVVVGAAAFLGSLSIYQAVTGNYQQEFLGLANRALEAAEHRARGPTDDANRYGQILLMAGSFGLALAWTLEGRKRWAVLGSLALIFAAILLTYSRGAFLTLVILVLFLGALRVITPRRLALILLAGIVLTPVIAPEYIDRIRSISGAAGMVSDDAMVEADGATRGRTTQMLAAALAFSEHPVLGVGPGQYVPYHSVRYVQRPEIAFREIAVPRRAHNLYVELAAELGAIGLLLFLTIPGLLLRDLWRIRKDARSLRPDIDRLALGFILAILAYLGSGMFLHLAFQRYYWLLIGLTAAAVWILRGELREERETGLPPVPAPHEEARALTPSEARR